MFYICPKSRHERGLCIIFKRKISFAIINVNCKYPRLNSFSLSCSIPLFALLLPPCLLLSATFCGLEPFQPASLSCSVVLFGRFHLPLHRSCRLTAKLRYENKQLALESTGEKNPPLMLLHKLCFFFTCPDAKP